MLRNVTGLGVTQDNPDMFALLPTPHVHAHFLEQDRDLVEKVFQTTAVALVCRNKVGVDLCRG
jgi:hypothetical protein